MRAVPCRWQAPHKGLEKEAHRVIGVVMGHTVVGACIFQQFTGEKKTSARTRTLMQRERESERCLSR